ncbi:MAG: hypothetical protein ACRBFS_13885 [Aureispira sp.]
MTIQYSIKQLGKKRAQIERASLELPQLLAKSTLADFIRALVEQQVTAYEWRQTATLLQALTPTQIEEGVQKGKVDVGERFEKRTVAIEAAITEALQAFEDGLYAIFADEEQLEQLEAIFDWEAVDCFTFIRLTFLAGSFW